MARYSREDREQIEAARKRRVEEARERARRRRNRQRPPGADTTPTDSHRRPAGSSSEEDLRDLRSEVESRRYPAGGHGQELRHAGGGRQYQSSRLPAPDSSGAFDPLVDFLKDTPRRVGERLGLDPVEQEQRLNEDVISLLAGPHTASYLHGGKPRQGDWRHLLGESSLAVLGLGLPGKVVGKLGLDPLMQAALTQAGRPLGSSGRRVVARAAEHAFQRGDDLERPLHYAGDVVTRSAAKSRTGRFVESLFDQAVERHMPKKAAKRWAKQKARQFDVARILGGEGARDLEAGIGKLPRHEQDAIDFLGRYGAGGPERLQERIDFARSEAERVGRQIQDARAAGQKVDPRLEATLAAHERDAQVLEALGQNDVLVYAPGQGHWTMGPGATPEGQRLFRIAWEESDMAAARQVKAGTLDADTAEERLSAEAQILEGGRFQDEDATRRLVREQADEAKQAEEFLTRERRRTQVEQGRRGRAFGEREDRAAAKLEREMDDLGRTETRLFDQEEKAQRAQARYGPRAEEYDRLKEMVDREDRFLGDAYERYQGTGVGLGRLSRMHDRAKALRKRMEKLAPAVRAYEQAASREQAALAALRSERGTAGGRMVGLRAEYDFARGMRERTERDLATKMREIDRQARMTREQAEREIERIAANNRRIVGAEDAKGGLFYLKREGGVPGEITSLQRWARQVRHPVGALQVWRGGLPARRAENRVQLQQGPLNPLIRTDATRLTAEHAYRGLRAMGIALQHEAALQVGKFADDLVREGLIPANLQASDLEALGWVPIAVNPFKTKTPAQAKVVFDEIKRSLKQGEKVDLRKLGEDILNVPDQQEQLDTLYHRISPRVEDLPDSSEVVWVPGVVAEGLGMPKYGEMNRQTVKNWSDWFRSTSKGAGEGLLLLADMVNNVQRAQVLYLNPGYAPAQLIGNGVFLLHQAGPFGLEDMAKTFKMLAGDRARRVVGAEPSLSDRTRRTAIELMGAGFTQAVSNKGVNPLEFIADQQAKFIDAGPRLLSFFYEARKAGFETEDAVEELFRRGRRGDKAAIRQVERIQRRALDAMVDFNRLSPVEKRVVSRVIWFYPWLRGAANWTARFPVDHPVQAAALAWYYQDLYRENRDLPFFQRFAQRIGEQESPFGTLPTVLSMRQLGAIPTVAETAGSILQPFVGGDLPQGAETLTPAYSFITNALFGRDPQTGFPIPKDVRGLDRLATLAEGQFGHLPAIDKALRMDDEPKETNTKVRTPVQKWLQMFLNDLGPYGLNEKAARRSHRRAMGQPELTPEEAADEFVEKAQAQIPTLKPEAVPEIRDAYLARQRADRRTDELRSEYRDDADRDLTARESKRAAAVAWIEEAKRMVPDGDWDAIFARVDAKGEAGAYEELVEKIQKKLIPDDMARVLRKIEKLLDRGEDAKLEEQAARG